VVALDKIDAKPEASERVRARATYMRNALSKALPAEIKMCGSATDAESPLIHLRLHSTPVANSEAYSRDVHFWNDVQQVSLSLSVIVL
jgi:hypothetical protein